MKKYRLVKDRNTGERAVVVYSTGEVVTEKGQPERYKDLRRKAINNANARAKNDVLRTLCGTSARQAKIDMGL